jgi:hypothetical protein
MLGFKRHPAEAIGEDTLESAVARLEQAQQQLAASPWDPKLREQYRLAHNAVADLSAPAVTPA